MAARSADARGTSPGARCPIDELRTAPSKLARIASFADSGSGSVPSAGVPAGVSGFGVAAVTGSRSQVRGRGGLLGTATSLRHVQRNEVARRHWGHPSHHDDAAEELFDLGGRLW